MVTDTPPHIDVPGSAASVLSSPARRGLAGEIPRYLAVGALNAVFTFVVFVVSLYVIRLHYLLALTVATGLGMVLTYGLNFVWVFRPESRLRFEERFVKYVVTNAATLGLNLIALSLVVETTGLSPLYAQAVIMGAIVALNFVAAKWWSLRPNL
jgi:putative flippase GtrA